MIKSGCTSSGGAPTPLRAYNRPTGTHPPPHHQGERWGMERPVSSEHQPRPARGTPPPGRTHLPTTATSHETHDRPPQTSTTVPTIAICILDTPDLYQTASKALSPETSPPYGLP
ncbi:MAG TPA: hypothetical protein VHZ51_31290 [Ktedonobacteraceae bacterium]|nr:hypothetical protein [Ktedonobacteraceae bacterium]